MKLPLLLLLSGFIARQVSGPVLRAEETNMGELSKQLQKRIEELEQKVNALARGQTGLEAGEDASWIY